MHLYLPTFRYEFSFFVSLLCLLAHCVFVYNRLRVSPPIVWTVKWKSWPFYWVKGTRESPWRSWNAIKSLDYSWKKRTLSLPLPPSPLPRKYQQHFWSNWSSIFRFSSKCMQLYTFQPELLLLLLLLHAAVVCVGSADACIWTTSLSNRSSSISQPEEKKKKKKRVTAATTSQ